MSLGSTDQKAWIRSLTLLGVGLTEMIIVPAGAAYFGYWAGAHWGQGVLGALLFGVLGFIAGTYRMWDRARWASRQEQDSALEASPEGREKVDEN